VDRRPSQRSRTNEVNLHGSHDLVSDSWPSPTDTGPVRPRVQTHQERQYARKVFIVATKIPGSKQFTHCRHPFVADEIEHCRAVEGPSICTGPGGRVSIAALGLAARRSYFSVSDIGRRRRTNSRASTREILSSRCNPCLWSGTASGRGPLGGHRGRCAWRGRVLFGARRHCRRSVGGHRCRLPPARRNGLHRDYRYGLLQ